MPKRIRYKLEDLPEPGSVFVVPLADRRFGVVRVVFREMRSGYAFVYLSPSPHISETCARPDDAAVRESLILTHHSWSSQPAGLWTAEPPPPEFIPVESYKSRYPEPRPQREAYSSWTSCTDQILLQWRWDHEREAVLQEDEIKAQRQKVEREIEARRREEILRTISFEKLSCRSWFDHWDNDLDGEFLAPSALVISSLLAELAALPKLTKAIVRKALKSAVQKFNALDESSHFIETTHREDIYEALELVLYAAKQPDLLDDIDEWRDW